MFIKLDNFCYQSDLLTKYNHLVHGFFNKKGSVFSKKQKILLSSLNIPDKEIIYTNQNHTDNLLILSAKNYYERKSKYFDAILVQKGALENNPVIAVNTADCAPIIMFDPEYNIISVIHAGWAGTLNGICTKVIRTFKDLGSDVKKIIVCIGPAIGSCCYKVEKKRTDMFCKKFGSVINKYIINKSGKYFIDLVKINYFMLLSLGVNKENIDNIKLCTKCQSHEFFSFREEKNLKGQNISLIGFK